MCSAVSDGAAVSRTPSINSRAEAMYSFFQTHPVLLAPMAGVSDVAFRTLCLEQGASLTYTEMVSTMGLSYANERTHRLLDRAPNEQQIAVQIFGHNPATMAAVAARIEEELGDALAYFVIILGCPARKIVSKGDGSKLMTTPSLAAEIVECTVAAVSVPVTCKIRRGYEEGNETAVELARLLESAGAAALTVHGRYAMQYYRGTSEWETIARVKEAVAIPVVGNGDIRSGADALAMRAKTGCDAVMIARAAEGNPWVFADVRAALAGLPQPPTPCWFERLAMARRHAELLAAHDERALVRMRKHAMWYLAGMPHASVARKMITSCSSLADFYAVFDAMEQALSNIAEEDAVSGGEGIVAKSDREEAVPLSTFPQREEQKAAHEL